MCVRVYVCVCVYVSMYIRICTMEGGILVGRCAYLHVNQAASEMLSSHLLSGGRNGQQRALVA